VYPHVFDAYDRGFLADPYPTYGRIRKESPVFFDDSWGLTFIARHEDVTTVLKDRDRFGRDFRHRMGIDEVDQDIYKRIYPPQWPTWTEYIRESFIDLEPPRHTRLRRLVSKAFTRRSSEVFRPRLEQAADAILDTVVETGSMEVISEYATPGIQIVNYAAVNANWIEITIQSAYQAEVVDGNVFRELAIDEITIWGRPANPTSDG